MIRLAAIGTKGYAGYLLERLWELPELCRVVAATSRDGASHPNVANCVKRGVRMFPNVDEMLAALDPDECDAVVCSTGIDSHYRYATQALKAGFHVLLEKPPVATIQELDALAELQRTTGRAVAIHFQWLYTDVNQRLKRLLASGQLGAIRRLRASAAWPRPVTYFQRTGWSGRLRSRDGWVLDGTIGNPLAHLLAQELFLATGRPGMAAPATMQAELYRANDIESEDTSCLRLFTDEGVEVFFCASLASATHHDVLLEIETELATVRQVDFAETVVCYQDGREEAFAAAPASKTDYDKLVRRHMLTIILEALAAGAEQPLGIAACRPYQVAWNAAFDANGLPHPVNGKFKRTLVSEDQQQVAIKGIERTLERAFEQRRLFSELGVSWTKPGPVLDCRAYRFFPIHPGLAALENGRRGNGATPAVAAMKA
jgi:predicted dehydrogenase